MLGPTETDERSPNPKETPPAAAAAAALAAAAVAAVAAVSCEGNALPRESARGRSAATQDLQQQQQQQL